MPDVDVLAVWLHARYCGCGFYCDTRTSGSWHGDAQELLEHLKGVAVRNTFLGLDASDWAQATPDNLPVNYMTGERVTVAEMIAGLAAMLRRLDEESKLADRPEETQ